MSITNDGVTKDPSGGGGMTVGSAVSGATADSFLTTDDNGNLAADGTFQIYQSTSGLLTLGATTDTLQITSHTEPIIEALAVGHGAYSNIQCASTDNAVLSMFANGNATGGTTFGVTNNNQTTLVGSNGPMTMGTGGTDSLTIGTNNTAAITIDGSTQVATFVHPIVAPSQTVRASRSTNQTIPNTAFTAVTFDTNAANSTASMHSTSSHTDRFVAPVSGWYLMTGNAPFHVSAVGVSRYAVWANSSGTQIACNMGPVAGTECVISCSTMYYLAANDWVNFNVYQDSGLDLTLDTTGAGGGIHAEFTLLH